MKLTDSELAVVLTSLIQTGGGALLIKKFEAEQRARQQVIPPNWREQAVAFAQEKGIYPCPPAEAGGNIIKPKPDRKVVTSSVNLLEALGLDSDFEVPDA